MSSARCHGHDTVPSIAVPHTSGLAGATDCVKNFNLGAVYKIGVSVGAIDAGNDERGTQTASFYGRFARQHQRRIRSLADTIDISPCGGGAIRRLFYRGMAMHYAVRDYLDRSECASTVDQLCDALNALVLAMGLNAFAYLALDDAQRKSPLLISTYDRTWTSHYLEHRYDFIDPVITRARQSPEPFVWGRHTMERGIGPQVRAFFNEAAAFGICHGVTVPIPFWRGASAALTAISGEARMMGPTVQTRRDEVFQFIAYDFHANVRNLIVPGRQIEGIHLSRREVECLEWAMRGKSAGDTAQLLGISRRTVVTHLERAKEKLGVRTVCQAVAIYATHIGDAKKVGSLVV